MFYLKKSQTIQKMAKAWWILKTQPGLFAFDISKSGNKNVTALSLFTMYIRRMESSNKKTGLVIWWNVDREGNWRSSQEKQDNISHNHSKQAHYFNPFSHCLIYSQIRRRFVQPRHVIVSSDYSDLTFRDWINDVQGEDEKHQSTFEAAGSLIGELPAVILGDVIFTTTSLLNLLLRATCYRPSLVSWAIWETRFPRELLILLHNPIFQRPCSTRKKKRQGRFFCLTDEERAYFHSKWAWSY